MHPSGQHAVYWCVRRTHEPCRDRVTRPEALHERTQRLRRRVLPVARQLPEAAGLVAVIPARTVMNTSLPDGTERLKSGHVVDRLCYVISPMLPTYAGRSATLEVGVS